MIKFRTTLRHPELLLVGAGLIAAVATGFGSAVYASGLPPKQVNTKRYVRDVLEQLPSSLQLNQSQPKQGGAGHLTATDIQEALNQKVPLPSGVAFSLGQGYRLDLVGGDKSTFHSYIDGFKVCGASVKSVGVGSSTFLVGGVPKTEPRSSFTASDFTSAPVLRDQIAARWPARQVNMDATAPCLYPLDDSEYRAAHEVWFALDDRQHYWGYHDGDRFLELHPITFDVDGAARIFAKNPRDATIQEFDLIGLTTSGRLGNQYFITQMDPGSSGFSRVFQSDNNFFFDGDTSSSAFAETSIFTNANRILGYFSSIGYTQFGGRPINLNLHPAIKANAQYIPSNTKNPVISIGDGEPDKLINLTTDMDVVNHEFGHHVVFGSLKETNTVIDGTRQVLVMHEALADYFAFAFSGDNCLGESICPAGSRFCQQENQCLRSADTLMTMTSGSRTEEHVRGQFLSGFLWDVRREPGVTEKTFDEIVLSAVKLLDSGSGYQDMLLNLYLADRNTNSGQYCSRIAKHADKRGIAAYLSYNCSNGQYTKLTVAESTSTRRSSRSSRSSGFFSFCGTIAGHGDATTGSWLYLLGALLPLLWFGRKETERTDA